MTGEYESLKKVLSTIEVKEGLNKDNIIEEIQEELKKQDQGLYQEWEKGEFDVNHGFNIPPYGKLTLLMIAAEYGHEKTVEVLLKKGANVNEKDYFDRTPLHLTVFSGHESVVNALIAAGADVNAVDRDEWTPLDYAEKHAK
ncbi:ankyrin repeat domain-containing protein [Wolbachia endosymbiont of Tribolium confusum]|uniref:ankyrin repeat domain-containing protein n=1 Tax=Wolbachia endosymbiont of Tribolium confusum TaxID=214474 RepID=UPI001CF27E94|nr:ankyrin repeat domain-containing protein [Wolbachia endosymbiont of Tribolium confusum]MCA7010200.1 ankyrin repeat domain-containing protein [Wolbachia endosymbiont of Tribolium confusum]